jgi:hypothetical protein
MERGKVREEPGTSLRRTGIGIDRILDRHTSRADRGCGRHDLWADRGVDGVWDWPEGGKLHLW